LGAVRADPGIVLEVSRARFELQAVDLMYGLPGPSLQVSVGSPANPTPSGEFPVRRVVENPSWTPGPSARRGGAEFMAPSEQTPMGVAKLPFSDDGSFAIHGGAASLVLGKPITLGCVRAGDPGIQTLLAWLEGRGAIGPAPGGGRGERRRRMLRPLIVRIR
jgi:hypothetical protein